MSGSGEGSKFQSAEFPLMLWYVINIINLYMETKAHCVIVSMWVSVHENPCAFVCVFVQVRACVGGSLWEVSL